LLRRGQALTAENQRANVRIAAEALAPVASQHQLVISHGNGPQVGLLALQAAAYHAVEPYPLDVLGAQTEGMIGYMIEQELGNLLPFEVPFATILTMVEVDPKDPAFEAPVKPIGPFYSEIESRRLAVERGWSMARDGDKFRRVVPSPLPQRIFEIRPIRWLLEHGTIVICSGGGGIPTAYGADGKLHGVEAVIDKDRASGLLAQQLEADFYLMATDVDAVAIHWGTPEEKRVRCASPQALAGYYFAAGSMGPKVEAACEFAQRTGKSAAIGALGDIARILSGEAGTLVSNSVATIEYAESGPSVPG
jgi:carbamate kinase